MFIYFCRSEYNSLRVYINEPEVKFSCSKTLHKPLCSKYLAFSIWSPREFAFGKGITNIGLLKASSSNRVLLPPRVTTMSATQKAFSIQSKYSMQTYPSFEGSFLFPFPHKWIISNFSNRFESDFSSVKLIAKLPELPPVTKSMGFLPFKLKNFKADCLSW